MFLRSATGERGSATVEMAISMLVIVPVILYALFMDDLLRFRLDAQEAAVSSVWDFTTRSYQQRSGKMNDSQAVSHVDQLIFCDHSSAFDSFNKSQDCQDPRHHKAVAGHACWLIPGSKQVTCWLNDSKLGAQFTGGAANPANRFAKDYNKGGFFTCEAKEAVLNYLLPKRFLQQFSKVKLTDKNESHGNVHTAASGATEKDVYYLPMEQLGLLSDTWAMNDVPDMDPGGKVGSGAKKQYYDRVKTIYTWNPAFPMFAKAAVDYFNKATRSGLLSYGFWAWGDNPLTPKISLKKQTSVGGVKQEITQEIYAHRHYFDQGWTKADTGDGNYQATYRNRGRYYLGHKSAQSNK